MKAVQICTDTLISSLCKAVAIGDVAQGILEFRDGSFCYCPAACLSLQLSPLQLGWRRCSTYEIFLHFSTTQPLSVAHTTHAVVELCCCSGCLFPAPGSHEIAWKWRNAPLGCVLASMKHSLQAEGLQRPESSSGNQPFHIPLGHKVMTAWLANLTESVLLCLSHFLGKSNESRAVNGPFTLSLALNTSPPGGSSHWGQSLCSLGSCGFRHAALELPKSRQRGKRKCVLLSEVM